MTLLEKLAAITEEMGALSKSGTNPRFSYAYVKGEDSMKQFRVLEIKHKIKVIPVVQPSSLLVTPKGDNGFITTFIMDYNIFDLESDQKLVVSIPTQGYDNTDKATFKGMTGGFKYFLLQTFSFSSDDPEKEDEEIPFKVPTETKPSTFKPKVGTESATPINNAKSKFSDMVPKTSSGVSFKESGLSGVFKPVEAK